MFPTGLSEVIFSFLDVETTGLEPSRGERIVEIGILRCQNGKVLREFDSLIHPEKKIPPEVQAIHGITDEMVRKSPKFAQVFAPVQEMLRGSVLVCHNAPFDVGFLQAEFKRLGAPFPNCPILDTLSLARRQFRFGSNTLGSVARQLGISTDGWHRALSDVRILKEVFDRFLEDFKRRGIHTLEEILSLQTPSSAVSFQPRK